MIQSAPEVVRRAFLDAAKPLISDGGDFKITLEQYEEASRHANRGLRLLGHAIAMVKAGAYLPAPARPEPGEPLRDEHGNPLIPVVGAQVKDRHRLSLMKQILAAITESGEISAMVLPDCLTAEYSHEQIRAAAKTLQEQKLIVCEGNTRGSIYRLATPEELSQRPA